MSTATQFIEAVLIPVIGDARVAECPTYAHTHRLLGGTAEARAWLDDETVIIALAHTADVPPNIRAMDLLRETGLLREIRGPALIVSVGGRHSDLRSISPRWRDRIVPASPRANMNPPRDAGGPIGRVGPPAISSPTSPEGAD